jgi:hypothetical protein
MAVPGGIKRIVVVSIPGAVVGVIEGPDVWNRDEGPLGVTVRS